MEERQHPRSSLPGDFSFKVADVTDDYGADENVPILSAMFYLLVTAGLFLALFVSTLSLNAKYQLVVLLIAIGVFIYNRKAYLGLPEGESYLDSYEVTVFDDDGNQTTHGRFGKWNRLVWAISEPPDPNTVELNGNEPERNVASIRTLIEWVLLAGGVIYGTIQFGQYYYAKDGPYFHDIFATYLFMLLTGLAFWFGVWVFRRLQGIQEEIHSHVEGLNFFLCRWVACYFVLWCLIGFVWLIDQ